MDGVTLEAARAPAAALRQLRRKVGMVFQFHCLFEHLSALKNVWLAPVHRPRRAPADAERRALELLRTLGVDHRRRRCRASSRAVKRSGSPSRARWPSIRRCC